MVSMIWDDQTAAGESRGLAEEDLVFFRVRLSVEGLEVWLLCFFRFDVLSF